MNPKPCEYCGATYHQPYEDGLVECRDRLEARVAELEEGIRDAIHELVVGYKDGVVHATLEKALGESKLPRPSVSEPPKVARNMSTPESRAFWESAERSAEEVASWPDWKRAGINVSQQRDESRPSDASPCLNCGALQESHPYLPLSGNACHDFAASPHPPNESPQDCKSQWTCIAGAEGHDGPCRPWDNPPAQRPNEAPSRYEHNRTHGCQVCGARPGFLCSPNCTREVGDLRTDKARPPKLEPGDDRPASERMFERRHDASPDEEAQVLALIGGAPPIDETFAREAAWFQAKYGKPVVKVVKTDAHPRPGLAPLRHTVAGIWCVTIPAEEYERLRSRTETARRDPNEYETDPKQLEHARACAAIKRWAERLGCAAPEAFEQVVWTCARELVAMVTGSTE